MANKTLMRINLLHPNNMEEIDISKFALQAKIHSLFLDPTGQHLLISVASRDGITPVDTLYLPQRSNKPKSTNKLKGYLITSVAWNHQNQSESVTGPIIVGTSKGVLFELELSSDDRFFQSGHEEYCKQLIDFGKENPIVISQLECRNSPSDDHHFLVLCTTPERLYQLAGRVKSLEERPMFLSLFNNYLGLPPRFTELPSSWKSSWLQIYHTPGNLVPRHFAWVVEQGIYYGDVSWSGLIHEESTIQKGLNPYPTTIEGSGPPCGMILCEYHLFIVWPQKIQGICILNNQVVYEGSIPEECGRLTGIAKDGIKGTIWVFAERAVLRYKVEQEGRNVWRIYLDQGNYEQAKKICSNDPSRLSQVLLKEAQDMFQKKEYTRSALLFSKTLTSFEEVTLKFVEVGQEDALKLYLHEKLNNLKFSEQTQVTLVVVWLLELYLTKLGNLRDSGQRNSAEYQNYDAQLKAFLQESKVRQSIMNNSSAIYELFSSHDDHDNYVNVSIMLQDYDRVLRHLIHHGRYVEALEVLNSQGSEKLFCQHIPTLLKEIPRDTVDCLISQGRRLNPVELLPSLVHCHSCHGHGKEVLRYIEHCINKLDITEEVVHNFLITLYVRESPEKLLPYFKLQGDDSESVHYDLKFALRECMSAGEDKCCVHILTTMGLYQEAVELALKLDTSLAKATANRPKDDQDLRKKLWLMIAAHVVQEEQDVSRAMDVLRECDQIKIEDILPFFPDFVTIDQFKDAICSSLQEYNHHIEDLKHEMDDAAKTAENIRKDIQKFKQKFSFVHAQDRCCECNYPLLTSPFYLFPCSHKFHQDCLSDAVMNILSESKQKKVSELRGRLLALSNDESISVTSGLWGDREQIRAEIDALVAGECLYCGDSIVSNIDVPFINENEWDNVMAEWQ